MSADQIEAVVKSLLELKATTSREQLDTHFLEFRTKNKLFYETILNGDFQPEIFKQMMKSKRELESGKDQYSVDVKFGKYMADKYIDPVVKK
jgi:hypothetical protein